MDVPGLIVLFFMFSSVLYWLVCRFPVTFFLYFIPLFFTFISIKHAALPDFILIIKFALILFGVVLLHLMRIFPENLDHPLMKKIVWVFLQLNIGIIALYDAMHGGLENLFPAIVLMLTIPTSHCVRVDSSRNLCFPVTRSWIILYSLWVWSLIYRQFPEVTALHLAVLFVAFVVGFANPIWYMQARAYTLFLLASINAAALSFKITILQNPIHFDKNVYYIFVLMGCALGVCSLFRFFWKNT